MDINRWLWSKTSPERVSKVLEVLTYVALAAFWGWLAVQVGCEWR